MPIESVWSSDSAGGVTLEEQSFNRRFRQTNLPNESDEYLANWEELGLAEIDLMRQRERVAELPPLTMSVKSVPRISTRELSQSELSA